VSGIIKHLKTILESSENKLYEMRNERVYKKSNDGMHLFDLPDEMEVSINSFVLRALK